MVFFLSIPGSENQRVNEKGWQGACRLNEVLVERTCNWHDKQIWRARQNDRQKRFSEKDMKSAHHKRNEIITTNTQAALISLAKCCNAQQFRRNCEPMIWKCIVHHGKIV